MRSIDERVKQLRKSESTKSGIARILLDEGFEVNLIAKAVPMAYSQVHSIAKKHSATQVAVAVEGGGRRSDWGPAARTPSRKSTKPIKSPIIDAIKAGKPVKMPKPSPRVGKLRTPGMPSDTDVGSCANCGHDLVIRLTNQGYVFTHVNVSAEEHLSTTQFCQAVPQVLIA